jgi:hypothetical protein
VKPPRTSLPQTEQTSSDLLSCMVVEIARPLESQLQDGMKRRERLCARYAGIGCAVDGWG